MATGPTLSQHNPFQYPTDTSATTAPPDVFTFDNPSEATWKDIGIWCTAMRIKRASAVARHRYPNVPGQTIEPMGREPIEVELETAWFGEDWRNRLENLAYTKDADQTSGLLILPGLRGQFDAFCVEMDEDIDLTMSGATVTLRFEEDAHESAYMVFSEDDLGAADAAIPADDADTVGSEFDTYEGMVTTTGTTLPTREVWAALASLESSIDTAQAACDQLTTDGMDRYLALTRVRYYSRRAFPDQEFLIASLE